VPAEEPGGRVRPLVSRPIALSFRLLRTATHGSGCRTTAPTP
jgi:hypothetical protein